MIFGLLDQNWDTAPEAVEEQQLYHGAVDEASEGGRKI